MTQVFNWFGTFWMDFAETFYRCFIREDRYMLLLGGIGVTIKVSLLAVILGIVIGLIIALCVLYSYVERQELLYKYL